MTEEYYYLKQVLGNWFSPYTKEEVQISVATYEVSQQPSREKILIRELLKNFPNSGDFYYYDDDEKEVYCEDMIVYPEISIGSVSIREITDDAER